MRWRGREPAFGPFLSLLAPKIWRSPKVRVRGSRFGRGELGQVTLLETSRAKRRRSATTADPEPSHLAEGWDLQRTDSGPGYIAEEPTRIAFDRDGVGRYPAGFIQVGVLTADRPTARRLDRPAEPKDRPKD